MACCSTSPAARICSAAKRRWPAISSTRLDATGFRRARRGGGHGRLRLGGRALRQRRASSRGGGDRGCDVAAADRGAARRCRHRRRSENRRPHARGRSRHPSARAVRRALRQGLAAPSRSGARPRRRADHAAPAGAGGDGRAALSRSDRARGRRARHHRASGAVSLPPCWSGAARARGCFRSRCFAPTARCTGSRSAPARRCAMPPRMRKLFEERLAVLGDACDPGFGFDMVRLSALVTERMRSGADRTRRARPCRGTGASDRPARRALRPAPRDAAGAAGHAYSGVCGGERCRRMRRAVHCAAHAGASSRTRLPPPVRSACSRARSRSMPRPRCRMARPFNFRWRRVTHQVAQVEGPERIAMEWWRDDRGNKLTRDYFRVESEERRADVALPRRTVRPRGRAAPATAALVSCTVFVCVKRRASSSAGYAELAVTTQFLISARRLRSRRAGVARQGAWPRRHRHRGSQQRGGRRARARDGQENGHRQIQDRGRRAPRFHRRHARHSRLSARIAPPGDGSRACCRSASAARKRAIAFSGLPDLLDYAEGLNLIVMPPARIDADALVKALRPSQGRHPAVPYGSPQVMLYRGDDRAPSRAACAMRPTPRLSR